MINTKEQVIEILRNNLYLELKPVPGTQFVEVHLMSRPTEDELNPVTVDYVYLDLDKG